MSAFETIKAAYVAFGRNDPSVLFGAMSAISCMKRRAILSRTATPTLVHKP